MADKVVLTEKQHLVYSIIVIHKIRWNGNTPSLRTIAAEATRRGTKMTDTTAMECIRAMPDLVVRNENGLELLWGVFTMLECEPEIEVEGRSHE